LKRFWLRFWTVSKAAANGWTFSAEMDSSSTPNAMLEKTSIVILKKRSCISMELALAATLSSFSTTLHTVSHTPIHMSEQRGEGGMMDINDRSE